MMNGLNQFQNSLNVNDSKMVFTHKVQDGSMEKNANLITDMYHRSRGKMASNKATIEGLKSQNQFIRRAALDLIVQFPDENAKVALFQALEDETNLLIRQKITLTLDKIEKVTNKPYYKNEKKFSFIKSTQYLKQYAQ